MLGRSDRPRLRLSGPESPLCASRATLLCDLQTHPESAARRVHCGHREGVAGCRSRHSAAGSTWDTGPPLGRGGGGYAHLRAEPLGPGKSSAVVPRGRTMVQSSWVRRAGDAGGQLGGMGLRAGGALRRMGTGSGAPEGREPGGAQGGSIHSGCIAAVHNVPISVLIRPLPSVLDPAKVQSLVDTILVSPRSLRARSRKRGHEGWGPGPAGSQLRPYDLDGLTVPPWASGSSLGLGHESNDPVTHVPKVLRSPGS